MAESNILLAPGEEGVFSRSFSPNLVLFWLKTNIVVTNRRIVVKYPNTILGVIPLGYEEKAMPMGSIAGVGASLKVFAGRLIFFSILSLIFLPILMNADSATGVIVSLVFLAFFVLMATNSIVASFKLTNNGGGENQITISFLEKGKLEEFKDRANEYIYSSSVSGQSWNQALQNPGNFQNHMGQVGQPQQFYDGSGSHRSHGQDYNGQYGNAGQQYSGGRGDGGQNPYGSMSPYSVHYGAQGADQHRNGHSGWGQAGTPTTPQSGSGGPHDGGSNHDNGGGPSAADTLGS